MYHTPVMLHQCIQGLDIQAEGTYVDVTFGGGGHSREILQHLQDGRLVAFDQDVDAAGNVPDDSRLLFVNNNFRYMKNFLKLHGLIPVDGILADLGISSWQIDEPGRGFSTRFEGPLDMRMDKNSPFSAAELINDYAFEELRRVFFLYGELKNASALSRELEQARKLKRIETTEELKVALRRFAPRGKENKFYAQVFQALRIEVNHELDVLKELLQQSIEVLRPGGRIVIMSYHSLEDRLVKNFFRSGNFEGNIEKDFFGNVLAPLKPLGKMIVPDQDEIDVNPRARSARLRVAEKTAMP